MNQAYKQLGNSVVVDVLQLITQQISDALNHKYSGTNQLEMV